MKKSLLVVAALIVLVFLVAVIRETNGIAPQSRATQPATTANRSRAENPKRDRIPVNTVCFLGPAGVFDTNDDIALYEIAVFNHDSLSANNELSDDFHFWLREKASVKVLYHGPYKGYVAPDAPQSTRDALNQFEMCQIQILDGAHKNRVGWVIDTELRCATNRGR